MKTGMRLILAIGAVAAASPVMAADTVTYNSAPTDGWHYGAGNDYSPANTAVLTTPPTAYTLSDQLYLRLHQTFQSAPASNGNGVYNFLTGTDPISFDWGIDQSGGNFASALLTLTNLGTGQTFSYNPFFVGNDNTPVVGGSTQNSYRLNWAGIGFDPSVNDTYQVNLTATGYNGDAHSLDVFAQVGTGAGAVPEPATWAMMLLGFVGIGGVMRRKTNQNGKILQIA